MLFVTISCLKRAEHFFWKDLKPLYQGMNCAMFGWNWPSGSGKRFPKFVNVLLLFRNYLPSEKALYLNKLEFSSPKVALCQVWLKLAVWFSRRRFFKFVNVFSQFRNYLPLKIWGVLHLNKRESPLPKDALFHVWYELTQWFWRRRWKCEKFMATTKATTTTTMTTTNFDQKSSCEPSGQVS